MKTLTFILVLLCLYSCSDPSQEKTQNIPPDSVSTTPVSGKITLDKLIPIAIYADSDIHIKFGKFIFQKNYIHDNYGTQYRYNEAERGDLYITCQIRVTSKSKAPTLPAFCAYVFKDGGLRPKGIFDYNFTQWQDYGTYLGNNADFSNDFAHTATIPFNIGLEVDKTDLKSPIYILAMKSGCVVRNEDRFQQPAVKYDNGTCVTGGEILTTADLNKFVIVKVLGK